MKYQDIPSSNDLLDSAPFKSLISRYGRIIVRNSLRQHLAEIKRNLSNCKPTDFTPETLSERVAQNITRTTRCSLIPIINATGTVLHTNLGRAPLPKPAIRAALEAAGGYCNLEFNLKSGQRGKRTDHVSKTISLLTGAEAAIAVNNNAGAVMLVLSAVSRNQEVIISRGELVEIGGGFRVPEVMEMSGAILKEVGTTNRTHPKDYARAISENTGLIMKAHQSNFKTVGFTSEVSIPELVAIGKKAQLPVMYDLGSGCFFDGTPFDWQAPLVITQIEAGVDIVTFSGDKLLGGPQAGIIAGKKKYIDMISTHPMARALRLDKMTLAALDASLKLYLEPEKLHLTNPTIAALCSCPDELQKRAEKIYHKLVHKLPEYISISLEQSVSTPGGGSLPLVNLQTWCLALSSERISSESILAKLRNAEPPIVARVQKDTVILDVRTIQDYQIPDLIRGVSMSFTEST